MLKGLYSSHGSTAPGCLFLKPSPKPPRLVAVSPSTVLNSREGPTWLWGPEVPLDVCREPSCSSLWDYCDINTWNENLPSYTGLSAWKSTGWFSASTQPSGAAAMETALPEPQHPAHSHSTCATLKSPHFQGLLLANCQCTGMKMSTSLLNLLKTAVLSPKGHSDPPLVNEFISVRIWSSVSEVRLLLWS